MLVLSLSAFFIPSEMSNPVMYIDKKTNPWDKYIAN